MQKLAINLLRKILLKRCGNWIDGRTVAIYHDVDIDKFCVIRCNEETFDIRERSFFSVDAAIDYFLEIYERERAFFTDEEAVSV